MRSKLIQLATFLVLLAVFFAPLQGMAPVVRAQEADAGNGNIITPTGAVVNAQNGTTVTPAPNNAATQALNTSAAQATQQAAQPPTTGGGGGDTTKAECNFGLNLSVCLSNVVYVFTVGIMSAVAYVGGFVLDYSLQITLNSATYAQSFITQGWAAVRDIANMAFIFILVYIAITIVLKVETAGTLKALASVVVMALLINFSFFFTRVVIDAGNILAVQFYNAIPAPALANAGQTSNVGAAVSGATGGITNGGATKDLTAVIMQATGVTQLLGPNSFSAAFQKQNNFFTNLITFSFVYIAMGFMLAILAMVFVGAGVKFLIRSVLLWFLIVASPLAFIAQAFNGANKTVAGYFKKWLMMLVEFSFFPAFFLFMFWIINLFATQIGGKCDVTSVAGSGSDCGVLGAAFANINSGVGSAAAAQAGTFATLASVVASVGVRLGILIAMLWFSMKLSDSFAKQGSGLVHTATGKVGGMAKSYGNWWGSRAAATPGFLARQTVGRAAFIGAESQWAKGLESKIGILGRPIVGGLKGLSSSNLDIRGAFGGKPKEGKGGFAAAVDARAKSLEKRGKYVKSFTEKDIQRGEAAIAEEKKQIEEHIKQKERDLLLFKAGKGKVNEDAAKKTEEDLKKEKDRLKKLEDSVKKDLETEGKKRATTLLNRTGERNWQNLWLPSRGSLEGAGKIRKIITEKSKKDKLADAAKEFIAEEGTGDEAPPAAPVPGGAVSTTATTGVAHRQNLPQTNLYGRQEKRERPAQGQSGVGVLRSAQMASLPDMEQPNVIVVEAAPTETAAATIAQAPNTPPPVITDNTRLTETVERQARAAENTVEEVREVKEGVGRIARMLKEQGRSTERLGLEQIDAMQQIASAPGLSPAAQQSLKVGEGRIDKATTEATSATGAKANTLPPRNPPPAAPPPPPQGLPPNKV